MKRSSSGSAHVQLFLSLKRKGRKGDQEMKTEGEKKQKKLYETLIFSSIQILNRIVILRKSSGTQHGVNTVLKPS